MAAAGQTGAILGLSVLFAFLFLVGLYESWIMPVAGITFGADWGAGRVIGILIGRCRSIFMPRSVWSC